MIFTLSPQKPLGVGHDDEGVLVLGHTNIP